MLILAVVLPVLLLGWLFGGMLLMLWDIDRQVELEELWDDGDPGAVTLEDVESTRGAEESSVGY